MDYDNVVKIINSEPGRSAWTRGVKLYALDLAGDLFDGIENGWIKPEDLKTEKAIEKALLNGAPNWSEYSWGGCSFIYDYQIAERLCNPSELKKTRYGDRRPNSREQWLDTQARALFQAARRVAAALLS